MNTSKSFENKKISIIGLGLIGGSLARAFRHKLGIRDITAVNADRDSIDRALQDGVIARGFTRLNDHVCNSDIIFICTPVRTAVQIIDSLSGKVSESCIVTDVASTKSEIIEHVNNAGMPFRFVGGHPMAGGEKSGYAAGSERLFENAWYILCPSRTSDRGSIDELASLISGIGAFPTVMDAKRHDEVTGAISHLPHIIASALVNLVKHHDDDGALRKLAAGGFRDITRIASSDPEMWENIVMSNTGPISSLIDEFIKRLEEFRAQMENNNGTEIIQFFKSARDYRNSLPVTPKGLIEPLYEITADIADRPGVIGEITTLLGSNGINIKNINISHSREFEKGCLTITLQDMASVDAALKLLSAKGYRVYRKS